MENEIPSTDVVLTEPVAEKTIAPEKFDGLSNREALKESIAYHREGKEIDRAPTPTKTEVSAAVATDPEPPAEFSKEGKEAWKAKDITGIQKEYRRVHNERTAEISRAQTAERQARAEIERERASVKPTRDLAERVKNYLAVRGEDDIADEVKIAQALQLVKELRSGNGPAIKAELLKNGIDVDKEASTAPNPNDPANRALQDRLERLETEREQEKLGNLARSFDSVFQVLGAQKNRTGEPVFPDLFRTDDEGKQLASRIGSRTNDPYFRKRVLERFPNADFTVLVREAYIAEQGRVSGEPVQVSTKSNQQHTDKARRATAANPGRTAPRVNDSNLIGKLSNREAAAKAIEIHRGQ